MREDSPAETSIDRKPIDGGRKRQPTRQPTLLAPPTPTPPPKLQKWVAEIRPYVQEVDFDDELSDDGFTPLLFSGKLLSFILYFSNFNCFLEAETQQVLLKLNSTSNEEDSFDFGALEEEETVAQPPASPATILRFIDLNRKHASSVAAPSKSAEHSGSSGNSASIFLAVNFGLSGNSTGSSTAGPSGSTGSSTGSSTSGPSGSTGNSTGSTTAGPSGSTGNSTGSSTAGQSGSTGNSTDSSAARFSGSMGHSTGRSSYEVQVSQTAGPSGSEAAGPSGYQAAGPSGYQASTSPGASTSVGSSGLFVGAGSSLWTKGSNLSKSKALISPNQRRPKCLPKAPLGAQSATVPMVSYKLSTIYLLIIIFFSCRSQTDSQLPTCHGTPRNFVFKRNECEIREDGAAYLDQQYCQPGNTPVLPGCSV